MAKAGLIDIARAVVAKRGVPDFSELISRGVPAATALGAGAFGAWLAVVTGLPAPLLTGPATLVTLVALAGARVGIPVPLRDAIFLILGMNIGTAVTPEAVATAGRWPGSLFGLALSVMCTMALGAVLMHRLFKMPRLSALLAATPGHLSFVLAVAEEGGADSRRVALVQSMRVLLLTLLVPVLIQLIDHGDLPTRVRPDATPLYLLVLLGIAAFGVGLVFRRLKMPAALLLGGMAVSGALHGTGLMQGAFPDWLSGAAFVTMGSLIGTRFNGVTFRMVAQAIVASFTLTTFAALIALAFAAPISALIGLPVVSVLIAYAPGGLETMMAMSVLLDANPAYVAAHHVFRLFFLSLLIPIAVAYVRRLARSSLAGAQDTGGAGGQRAQGEAKPGQKRGDDTAGDDDKG